MDLAFWPGLLLFLFCFRITVGVSVCPPRWLKGHELWLPGWDLGVVSAYRGNVSDRFRGTPGTFIYHTWPQLVYCLLHWFQHKVNGFHLFFFRIISHPAQFSTIQIIFVTQVDRRQLWYIHSTSTWFCIFSTPVSFSLQTKPISLQ